MYYIVKHILYVMWIQNVALVYKQIHMYSIVCNDAFCAFKFPS